MKKIYSIALITGFLLLSLGAISQPPPPPNNPKDAAPGNAPVGTTAPVGSGTLLLIGLAAAYAGRKMYVMHASEEE
jgi:hypothetical protein